MGDIRDAKHAKVYNRGNTIKKEILGARNDFIKGMLNQLMMLMPTVITLFKCLRSSLSLDQCMAVVIHCQAHTQ